MCGVLVICLLLLCTVTSCTEAAKYLNLSGDIMLGGLFPIHANGIGALDCGRLQVEDGLQMLEAMLFTVKEINNRTDILPYITLGVIAYDTCDSPVYALQQSLDFIKGFIAHYNGHERHSVLPKDFVCPGGSSPEYKGGNFDKVVALIGEQSSAVTMQVATMLRLFHTPIVSYLATSPALSNKDRFPTFFRTVPSDENQAKAMLELIRQFNWTYVSIVYSDTEYGNQGYETLQRAAAGFSVCFSTPLRVSNQHFSDHDYDQIVHKLVNNSHSRVVIVFAEKPTVVLQLVASMRRLKVETSFVWLLSHGWTVTDQRENHLLDFPIGNLTTAADPKDSLASFNRPNVYNEHFTEADVDAVLEGALAIQPLAGHLKGFDKYLAGLTIENHGQENPWFQELAKILVDCNSNETNSEHSDSIGHKDCKLIPVSKWLRQYSCLHFVRDAVYAVATALHNMHKDKCGGAPGVCENMTHIENLQMVHYLSKVTFKDAGGNPFRFQDGDGPPRYSILNFQRLNQTTFLWKIVGNYSLDERGKSRLFLDSEKIRYRKSVKQFPQSHCTQTCEALQVKTREYDDTCCWSCISCGPYEMRKNDYHCEECDLGYRPTPDKNRCEEVPEDHIHYRGTWVLPALIVATVGVVLTLVTSYVFWRNAETPVVKASGRELSYLLLLGTFIEFFVSYIVLSPPTVTRCILTRFFLGFSFTLCYAAIVTKTNRIARIFRSGGQIHRTRCISPTSQVSITVILTSVEIFILVAWFWYDPPRVDHIYPSRDSRLRVCTGLGNFSYLISLFYPFILIGVCTVYAFLTRKCPDGFNETKHIGFTNYTAIIIWLAFVPLYIAATNYNIRMVTLAMSLSLSGFVQLGCLFLPKLYIVVFTPEKNTKEGVMGHNSSFTINTLSNNTPNSADGAMKKPDNTRNVPLKCIYNKNNTPSHRKTGMYNLTN